MSRSLASALSRAASRTTTTTTAGAPTAAGRTNSIALPRQLSTLSSRRPTPRAASLLPAAVNSNNKLTRRTAGTASFATSARQYRPVSAEQLKSATPAPMTDDEYHEVADEYLDGILTRFEELQEKREDVDVEYSAGVMKIGFVESGIYVINKQPPNKQIWLSSPVSGPKRFDYVLLSEGQADKQDTATGAWVYLRDGTTLDDLLHKETGISLESSSTSDIEP